MKKLICYVLMLIVLLNLAGCTMTMPEKGNDGAVDSSTNTVDDENNTSGNKITEQEDESENSVQQEDSNQFEAKNLGDKIALDFVEMTLDKITSAEEMKPTDTNGVYSYMSDKEGEKYFYLFGTIKNIGAESYSVENIVAEVLIDDKYKYNAYIKADDGGNDFYGDYVKPFGSVKYYLYASIPDELMAQYKTATISFGFSENFSGSYYDEFDECDYLYRVTASK